MILKTFGILQMILLLTVLATERGRGRVLAARKHWKRAPVRGAFDVDVYAYNKPVVNLLDKEEQPSSGPALPMGQLLRQLAESSRKLDREEAMGRSRSQLGEGFEDLHAMRDLYSSEFHVVNQGKRKIVWVQTLRNGTGSGQDRKQAGQEVMVEEKQPLNMKLALPTLPEEGSMRDADKEAQLEMPVKESESESEAESQLVEMEMMPQLQLELPPSKLNNSEAISAGSHVNGNSQELETAEQANNQSHVKDNDSTKQSMMFIEVETPVVDENKRQEMAHDDDDDGDDDGHRTAMAAPAVPVPTPAPAPAPAGVAVAVKPVKPQSKLKSRRRTKRPHEVDAKPTTATQRTTTKMTMTTMTSPLKVVPSTTTTTADIKGGVKPKVEKVQQVQQVQGERKGRPTPKPKPNPKPKRQRRPQQEIETTTNWWQILPYAEIRKFLNTIYDSIVEDDDERRRHHHRRRRRRRAQRI